MTSGARGLSRPIDAAMGALVVALGLCVALVLGSPGVSGVPVLVIAITALVSAVILARFYAAYLVLVAGCFILASVAVSSDKSLNAFDLLLPFMMPMAYLGSVRRDARADEQANETGPGHDRIREATRRFTRSVIIYYSIAAVSLIRVAFTIGVQPMIILLFALIRTVEGTLMFSLGIWWMRSERRVRQIFAAVGIGGLLLVTLLLVVRVVVGTVRPGMTWVVNDPEHPTTDPNQAGLSTALLMAFVFAHHSLRFRLWNYLAVIASVTILVLSGSRSGLLAAATFLILNMRQVRVRYVLMGLASVGLALLVAPQDFRNRMLRTVTMHRGSTELYTWMIRVYGYLANVKAFLDNWIIGVGFLAGGFVTQNYNPLALQLPGAENYFLETAVGLGVVGLASLAYVFVRLFQLGRVVGEVSPPGTLGHRMARYHAPLIVGIMVACLTGDNLVGVVSNAQLAVWCAVLVRAGHHSLRGSMDAPAEGLRMAPAPLSPLGARAPA